MGRILDRAVAIGLLLLALRLDWLAGTNGYKFWFGLMAALIGFSHHATMVGAVFLGPFFARLTYFYCDIRNGPESDLLHSSHDYLWLLVPFCLLRGLYLWFNQHPEEELKVETDEFGRDLDKILGTGPPKSKAPD